MNSCYDEKGEVKNECLNCCFCHVGRVFYICTCDIRCMGDEE